MLYTIEWVREKYNYYNNLLWDGKLPDFSDVEFKIINTKNTWGRGGCTRWLPNFDGTYSPERPYLALSNYYDAPESAKLNTLVHEMIHIYEVFCEPQYIFMVLKARRYNSAHPKDGHGKVFYEQANRVKNLTGIEITRFVSQEKQKSASLSDSKIKNINNKIKKSGGITLYLFKGLKRTTAGYNYAYAKVTSDNAERLYDNFLKDTNDSQKYFESAIKCKCFNISIENLKSCRSLLWYPVKDLSLIKDLDVTINDIFYDERGLENDILYITHEDINDNENESIEDFEPQEKRYKTFRLKLTNGKMLELNNVTKPEIKELLKAKFPQWKDEVIDKLLNNNNLYIESTMKKNNLDFLIESSIKKVLKEKLNNVENIENEENLRNTEEDLKILNQFFSKMDN